MDENKQTGTVKWFDPEKGYGFIQPEAGGDDLFVHMNNITAGPITEGSKVSFSVEQTEKGPAATDVSVTE